MLVFPVVPVFAIVIPHSTYTKYKSFFRQWYRFLSFICFEMINFGLFSIFILFTDSGRSGPRNHCFWTFSTIWISSVIFVPPTLSSTKSTSVHSKKIKILANFCGIRSLEYEKMVLRSPLKELDGFRTFRIQFWVQNFLIRYRINYTFRDRYLS